MYDLLWMSDAKGLSAIWGKVFKNRLSKICERQSTKNVKVYGLFK